MHMADALLRPAVAAAMYVASGTAAGISVRKLKKEELLSEDNTYRKLPAMAVMSALVFAGQMINYSIPGTGSSGHLSGGILLAAILGPWAAFLSMIAVLTIQCLFFADGGLMALGANIWNMGFYGCFIGYLLIFRPVVTGRLFSKTDDRNSMRLKIAAASILACIISLQLGAFSVVAETSLSGITELPFMTFLRIMQPIHLAIGLVEGLITSAVLIFIYETRPELMEDFRDTEEASSRVSHSAMITILVSLVVIVAGAMSLFASPDPDGLEWSMFGNRESGYSQNMGLNEENYGIKTAISDIASKIQEKTAFLPDYAFRDDAENPAGTSVSGLLGAAMVGGSAIAIALAGGFFRKKHRIVHSEN